MKNALCALIQTIGVGDFEIEVDENKRMRYIGKVERTESGEVQNLTFMVCCGPEHVNLYYKQGTWGIQAALYTTPRLPLWTLGCSDLYWLTHSIDHEFTSVTIKLSDTTNEYRQHSLEFHAFLALTEIFVRSNLQVLVAAPTKVAESDTADHQRKMMFCALRFLASLTRLPNDVHPNELFARANELSALHSIGMFSPFNKADQNIRDKIRELTYPELSNLQNERTAEMGRVYAVLRSTHSRLGEHSPLYRLPRENLKYIIDHAFPTLHSGLFPVYKILKCDNPAELLKMLKPLRTSEPEGCMKVSP